MSLNFLISSFVVHSIIKGSVFSIYSLRSFLSIFLGVSPVRRLKFLYKTFSFSQPIVMKIKVCDTEMRTRDEREILYPNIDKRRGHVRDDG